MSQSSVSDPRAVTRDIFSATLGSICCCYTGQPFDTVKVRYVVYVWSSPLVMFVELCVCVCITLICVYGCFSNE